MVDILGTVFLLPKIFTQLLISKSLGISEGFEKVDYFGRFFTSISLVTTPFIVKIKHMHNLLTLYIAVKDKYQEIFE